MDLLSSRSCREYQGLRRRGSEVFGGKCALQGRRTRFALFVLTPLVHLLVLSYSSRLQSTSRSERWSLANAGAVLLSTAGTLWLRTLGPILVVGLAMLGLLVVAERKRWTPHGHFGVANAVTTVRAVLLALLPAAAPHPSALIGLSLLVLALDGVDGWLARRYDLASEFGEFLDKETDALFLLLLCGLTAFQNELPIWIVGAGLLRYGFVLTLFLLPTLQTTETRSTAARYVYAFMVGALLLSFLPYPAFYRPVVAVAVTALLVSFGRSLRGIVVSRPS